MALEEPFDIITRWLEAMATSSALFLLIHPGSLQRLPADGSSISAKEPANAANVDLSAITRAFRIILVNGIATKTAPDKYAHNLLSQVLQPEALGAFFLICETECSTFFGGKIILQDLPIVIDSLKSEDLPGIEPTAHNIFTI